MNYSANLNVSEEIEGRETDPSYLKLYVTCTRGLLINFNVKRLLEGIRRMKT